MKKITVLLLTMMILVSLIACSSNSMETGEGKTKEESASATNTSEAAPETSPERKETETTENAPSTAEETTTTPNETTETTPGEENNVNSTEPANPDNPTPPVHTHSFSAATCTEPKKCSCGAAEGEALGHDWQSATCETPKTCAVCKTTEGVVLAHDFYAGECKSCKAEDPSMLRIYAKDETYGSILYSFVLPRSWTTYAVGESNDGTTWVYSEKFDYWSIVLPVFRFLPVEHGVVPDLFVNDGVYSFSLVLTGEKKDLYVEALLPGGLDADGVAYNDYFDLDHKEEYHRKELEEIIAMRQEIIDSCRWEG